MSYYTHLSGTLAILPPLRPEQMLALADALRTNTSWCVSEDGAQLTPIDVPTRTYYWEELQTVIDTHLKPGRRRLDGEIRWKGEQEGDTGTLRVVRGRVQTVSDAPESLTPEDVRGILACLESGDPALMRHTLELIGALPRPLPGVTGVLRPLLSHPAPETRQWAAEGLRQVKAKTPAVVADLIQCLADPHEWVRSAAAGALGEMGQAALPAISALEQLQNDPSYGPRGRAAEALARLQQITS